MLKTQTDAIPLMKRHAKPADNYREIAASGNATIQFAESRAFLANFGILGEILSTQGHSDDSISLLLDDGSVFTGDLPPVALAADNPAVATSWRLLRDRGGKRVYPGHGPTRPLTGSLRLR